MSRLVRSFAARSKHSAQKRTKMIYRDEQLGNITLYIRPRVNGFRFRVTPEGITATCTRRNAENKLLKQAINDLRPQLLEAIEKTKAAACNCTPEKVKAAEKQLKVAAREKLPARLAELAALHGLTYHRVTINAAKTHWGCCRKYKRTGVVSICLSCHLMLLPDHLIDYVLLHELAHIRQSNHSKAYWEELNRMLGCNAHTIEKELNRYDLYKMISEL
jgi:predicted metal-dependent hydrolase